MKTTTKNINIYSYTTHEPTDNGNCPYKKARKFLSLVSGDGIVFHQLDPLKQKISVKNQLSGFAK